MFLGCYDFDGDPGELLAAYDRMMEKFPPEALLLHVCVEREGGISVYDACPSREVFSAFAAGPDFNEAVAAAGLPAARVTLLGDVHRAGLRERVE
jgi:hypothetical protein